MQNSVENLQSDPCLHSTRQKYDLLIELAKKVFQKILSHLKFGGLWLTTSTTAPITCRYSKFLESFSSYTTESLFTATLALILITE